MVGVGVVVGVEVVVGVVVGVEVVVVVEVGVGVEVVVVVGPMNTTKSLTQIAAECGVDVSTMSRIWNGERRGSYPLYVALRKHRWPLPPSAEAHEAAAKTTYTRERRKAK